MDGKVLPVWKKTLKKETQPDIYALARSVLLDMCPAQIIVAA